VTGRPSVFLPHLGGQSVFLLTLGALGSHLGRPSVFLLTLGVHGPCLGSMDHA